MQSESMLFWILFLIKKLFKEYKSELGIFDEPMVSIYKVRLDKNTIGKGRVYSPIEHRRGS